MQELIKALVAAQAELTAITKNKTAKVTSQKGSYEYSYASLAAILEAVSPVLAAQGLAFTSRPCANESGFLVLDYELMHTSGERLGDRLPLMLHADASFQQVGSAVSYARRYAITAVLNLSTEDDDGAAASAAPARAAEGSAPGKLSRAQIGKLLATARTKGWRVPEDVMQTARVIMRAAGYEPPDRLDEVPAGAMDALLVTIESGVVPADQRSDIPPADPDEFATPAPSGDDGIFTNGEGNDR